MEHGPDESPLGFGALSMESLIAHYFLLHLLTLCQPEPRHSLLATSVPLSARAQPGDRGGSQVFLFLRGRHF